MSDRSCLGNEKVAVGDRDSTGRISNVSEKAIAKLASIRQRYHDMIFCRKRQQKKWNGAESLNRPDRHQRRKTTIVAVK